MAAHFTSPPDPRAFKAQVWEVVRQVPPGKVITYGQVVARLPLPPGMDEKAYRAQAARWVGNAMAGCPDGVPWQRVVNAQGKSSLKGSGAEQQRELLEAEGVLFDERQRIDLARFAWTPEAPSQDLLPGL